MGPGGAEPTFKFFKGAKEEFANPGDGSTFNWEKAAHKVREQLSDAFNAQNLTFLLGSGASSHVVAGKELGVPTMQPMAKEYLSSRGSQKDLVLLTQTEVDQLKNGLGLDLSNDDFQGNLERLMEALVSFSMCVERSTLQSLRDQKDVVQSAFKKVVRFVRSKCTDGEFAKGDDAVLGTYKSFYRKLIFRERTRSRPWVFTTNYDLFNERAMDQLGIPYANGFLGSVERRFNPATYRYSLAEQLDLSSQKWNAVDGFVHLGKLHGSVNWVEDGDGFYRVREIPPTEDPGDRSVMIYPTPMKQTASFGSPYVDLFRQFQLQIFREQSVLVVIGYGFGDQHINNLIYQALTIPSFRLILFSDPAAQGAVGQLLALNDPRVWVIGGDGPQAGSRAHYFHTLVEHFMPQLPGNKVEQAVAKVISALAKSSSQSSDQ